MNKRDKKQIYKEPYIDYLVKDYQSFRRLLLDRLCLSNPQWKDPNIADIGLVIIELLAYAADQLSYYQDAVATEAYLGTARKRVSIKRHARLLGYDMCTSEDMEIPRHNAPYTFVTAQTSFWGKTKCVDEMNKIIIKPKTDVLNDQESKDFPQVYNPPYRDVLSYRVGTYRTFKKNMIDDLRAYENFKNMNFVDCNDFVFDLIDAWAIVCDILTFYQERIVNEGYIRTATVRRSLIELCRFVGKELSTGVAADTFLAFGIDESQLSKIRIPASTQVKNIPVNDELPQLFETTEEIWASPEWNQIKPLKIIRHPHTPTKEDIIFIDKDVEELSIGQYIAISGIIKDKSKKIKSEINKIKDIKKNGKQILILEDKINTEYIIETVNINANITLATHGESRSEILGSGDPTIRQQEFKLKFKPLTYVSGETDGERIHTLQIFVDDIKWNGVDNFFGREPNERCYIIRHDEEFNTHIIFGDGIRGARPPRGVNNIRARYRVGLGLNGMLKSGELKIIVSQPLGVRSVTNPLDTKNAGDPESISEAREKILTNFKIIESTFPIKERDSVDIDNTCDKFNRINYGERLFELLPQLYREKDSAFECAPSKERGPLKELLQVLGKPLEIIEANIAQMYKNWFIETCEPWVIPYIADIIGINLHGYDIKDHEFIRTLIINLIKQNSCTKIEDCLNDGSHRQFRLGGTM